MLILHCGASTASRDQVFAVNTPEATDTWKPIPHSTFIDSVLKHSEAFGLELNGESYGLTTNNKRLFGVLSFKGGEDYGCCIGIRNSHDKSMTAGIVAGARIFVCDNLAFSGGYNVKRRHTSGLDLDSIISAAFEQMPSMTENLTKNLNRLKMEGLSDDQARSLIFQSVAWGIIPSSKMLDVWNEYREPSHEEFSDRTKFSLLMAITEKAKSFSTARFDKLHKRLPALLEY